MATGVVAEGDIAPPGAGPTWVEVAGQIAELSRRALKRNHRGFDPARVRVVLLDAAPTVLPTFRCARTRRHRSRWIARENRGAHEGVGCRGQSLRTRNAPGRAEWRVASFDRVRVGGAVAWLLWLFVHLAFLTGFKNRVATLARWAIAFLGRGRPERTITEQQVFARTRTLEADSV